MEKQNKKEKKKKLFKKPINFEVPAKIVSLEAPIGEDKNGKSIFLKDIIPDPRLNLLEEKQKEKAHDIIQHFKEIGFFQPREELLLIEIYLKSGILSQKFLRDFANGTIGKKDLNLKLQKFQEEEENLKRHRMWKFLYWFSPISLIGIIPIFGNWIEEIKKKYQIIPKKYIFSPYSHFIGTHGLREKFFKELIKEEAKRFPEFHQKLDSEISKFIKKKTKLPNWFHSNLKAKILYSENLGCVIDLIPHPIRVSHIFKNKDPKTLKYKKPLTFRYWNEVAREIETLHPFDDVPYDGFLHQRYYWYLQRQIYKPKDANRHLVLNGFREVNYEKNDSRMLREYEKLWLKW